MKIIFLLLAISSFSINLVQGSKEELLKAVSARFGKQLFQYELSKIDPLAQKQAEEKKAELGTNMVKGSIVRGYGETMTIVLDPIDYYELSWDSSMKLFLDNFGWLNLNKLNPATGKKLFGFGLAWNIFDGINGQKMCQYIITTGRATSNPYNVNSGSNSKKYTVMAALQQGPNGDVLLVSDGKEEAVMKTAGLRFPHLLQNELDASNFLKGLIQSEWAKWEASTQKVDSKSPKVVFSEVIELGTLSPQRANESRFVLLVKKQNGQDLQNKVLYNENFNILQLLRICRQIWFAIAFMHLNGITHGDIKPDNFLYDPSANDGAGQLAILDFAFSIYKNESARIRDDSIGSWDYRTPYQHTHPGKHSLTIRKLIDIGASACTFYVIGRSGQNLPWAAAVDEILDIETKMQERKLEGKSTTNENQKYKNKEQEIIQSKLNFFDAKSSEDVPTDLQDILDKIKILAKGDTETTEVHYKEVLCLFDVKIQELMKSELPKI